MVDLRSLSSALQGEVMVDIANGYFGARKAIDDERELLEHAESHVRLAEQRAYSIYAQLETLLTSAHDLKELLGILGVPVDFMHRVESVEPCLSMTLPFAFTKEGQYEKCVLETYDRMHDAFDFFLHGMPYEKHGTLEKYGRTTGYNRYMKWCGDLNECIVKVNRDRSPSQVLNVVRGMDVEKISKQRVLGTVNSKTGCAAGDDMCLLLVPCEGLEEMRLPELPALDVTLHKGHSVSTLIKEYASEVYKRERKKVDSILEILKKN